MDSLINRILAILQNNKTPTQQHVQIGNACTEHRLPIPEIRSNGLFWYTRSGNSMLVRLLWQSGTLIPQLCRVPTSNEDGALRVLFEVPEDQLRNVIAFAHGYNLIPQVAETFEWD